MTSDLTLSSVELSDLAKDNFRYNTRKILRIIIVVYAGLTFSETVLLMIAGMNWFDAVTTSFSSVATGGFITRNQSIMAFDSVWIEAITAIFMIAGAIHFGLIYATIKGKRNNIFRSEVTRYFVLCLLAIGVIAGINLYTSGAYAGFWESLRYGLFQTIAYGTTTGFASANAAVWPGFTILLLIFISIQCGCAGSTSGGVKVDRVLLLFKSIKARMLKLQHPNAIVRIKLNGITQDDSAVNAAILLISFYLLAAFASTLLLTLANIDLLTAFSSSISCLSNVGSGFGRISNLESMDLFPWYIKFWLTIVMIFGRLEIFGLIHLLSIRSWK